MPGSYKQLDFAERQQVYFLRKQGLSCRGIARQLGRSPSTISRELRRNSGGGGYRFSQAQRMAWERRSETSSVPRKMTGRMWAIVEGKLSMQWSPEQISGRLRLDEVVSVSAEWIYRHVWEDKRNGGVTYSADHVIYEDKRGNRQELDNYHIIRKFDDLLDVCNGLLLAFSIFILTRKDDRYRLPVNLLIEELRAETRTPYWEVDGCLPSTQINGTQLIIYARINTMDERKVNFSLFQTAIMVEKIAPGYDRYFFFLRSEKCLPGFAAFDGGRLAEHRVMKSQLDQYGDVLENNLLFFVPKLRLPRILKKVETLWLSYKIHKPSIASYIRQQLGWINVAVRNTDIHRNAWGVALKADIVIAREVGIVDQKLIKRSCHRIVKKALKEARANLSFLNVCRYLPLGFCRIFVYQRDYRARRLSGFGLAGDLICTVQVQYIKRITSPDIAGATVEVAGRYRIAWNRSWLGEKRYRRTSTQEGRS